ncbi:MAG: histidine kinase [Deltaproteobacteria bacterium RIFOXYD12_FULL_50_9]|nr:MAG: histidine kinase [Deltaproteobacteria bacterium RIFOXYD12_FULL_50_9]
MLRYKVIEIFTSEEARWHGQPLYDAVVGFVREQKMAARCLVTRATDGCYENGEIASRKIEILSFNMPLRITIVLPSIEFDRILPSVEEMVTEGIVTVQEVDVIAHKTRKRLLPRQIKVRDIMTPSPTRVTQATPLDEVVRLLLTAVYTGVPVVDENSRPVGIVTQTDLIYKGGMPLRLGLLAASNGDQLAAVLETLASKIAREVMTSPAVIINGDKLVTEAIDTMLTKKVKRLPVVDSEGRLQGMLSRLDIFRAIMRESPEWTTFAGQRIEVSNLRLVSDISRRDTHAVLPETPVEEVIRLIDSNDFQRISVVDADGRFLGLISDRDLLGAFMPDHPEGIWNYLATLIPFTERGKRYREFGETLRSRTAADVMNVSIVTVREDAPIDEAIRLMIEKGLKRLPVLNAAGRFKGMISRDSLLRTGFASQGQKPAGS